ncbi:hypothetical protein [Sphingobacterium arenae]|uniref:Uncharacterized protein n=1 Tax=Sphingobacterium arenae TaxID=1280598 RepID=A0ABR7Y0J9_9SPHI|nr:hypothetical protein [Sphingobacterium arenae]MBD1424807.1 hypothetical protein [Sphingobacterium arenae]
MNNIDQIKLTAAFKQACEIFNMKPEFVIQQFVDHVDIARYMCFPFEEKRWANVLVMEQIIAEIESADELNGYYEFSEKWAAMMKKDRKNAFENTKKLLDEWHKVILENRIYEIMKDDDERNDNLSNKD